LESIGAALRLAPGIDAYWAQFADLVRYFNFRHPLDPWLRDLLHRALAHPAVDPGNLVRPITSMALSRPPAEALADPLLLGLLEHAVCRDLRLEALVSRERRRALLEGPAALAPTTLCAVAHQCFNTQYVFDESSDETAAVAALGERLTKAPDAAGCAVYACYRPLRSLPEPLGVAEVLSGTRFESLGRRQIAETLEEERLRRLIPAVGPVRNGVSHLVGAMYEEHPYPRWLRTQTSFEAGPLGEILEELFPHVAPCSAAAAPRILVAGCGTGQNAIATARRFSGASVLAVDLSLASLAYARRKTEELGIGSIEYRQADLLALDSIGERFDLVEASGVLHHLADPLEGWKALLGMVAPGGFMRIGLYSELGRRNIVRARELIDAHGIPSTAEGIRRCRREIAARLDDPLLASLTRNEDFYSLSGCRDLMFHVQEHRFRLPQVASMLETLGLEFIGFEFPDSGATAARYRGAFPKDLTMTDLARWDQFEQANPDTFARMYQFWARLRT
jgi:2-polyprenyl-3-methyl-5-hydroxy-6-metoxy-1,4-benzoquinol methylase